MKHPLATLGLAWLLAHSLTACGGSGGSAPAAPAPAATPSLATTSSIGDFPDPFVLVEGATSYAYATNGNGAHVQLLSSANRVNWTRQPDAMPTLAPWVRAATPDIWAPEVIKLAANRYLLYYTGRDNASGKQCVGVAEGTQPAGPFVDKRSTALLCQVAEGGTIDASPFLDSDGQLYLYAKNDGNCCGQPTTLYAQKLSADGLSLSGPAVPLFRNTEAWAAHVIEAPFMWKRDGAYQLFYSGNAYDSAAYALGLAHCTSPVGPCTLHPGNPVLKSNLTSTPPLIGPGHNAMFNVGGTDYMAYAAWQVTASGARGTVRYLYIDKVDWVNGVPTVAGPSLMP